MALFTSKSTKEKEEGALARFLEGEEITVVVDYTKSTSQLLAGGGQKIGYPSFNPEGANLYRSGVKRTVRAFSHEEFFLSERGIAVMRAKGYEPADARTTIGSCNALPDLQLLRPVLALGTIARDQGRKVVLCCCGTAHLVKPDPFRKVVPPSERVAVIVPVWGGFEKRYLTLGMRTE